MVFPCLCRCSILSLKKKEMRFVTRIYCTFCSLVLCFSFLKMSSGFHELVTPICLVLSHSLILQLHHLTNVPSTLKTIMYSSSVRVLIVFQEATLVGPLEPYLPVYLSSLFLKTQETIHLTGTRQTAIARFPRVRVTRPEPTATLHPRKRRRRNPASGRHPSSRRRRRRSQGRRKRPK